MRFIPIINLKLLLFFGVLITALNSCLKDPSTTPPITVEDARARIEITDAAIDDPNIKAVLITVIDIKVDGKSWAGFDGKSTFDLLSYQNGQTKLMGEGVLEAGTYQDIVLVLDTETDANGDSPGCYIKDAQGKKRKLDGGSQWSVKTKGSFITKSNETTEAIIDMDLRKCIIYQSGSDSTFRFVTDPELTESIRLMDKVTTGSIAGDCTDGLSGSKKVIVYAYKKGAYNSNEKFFQGASQIQFKNAVTSSVLAADGTYKLSFLESGNYELHYISYQEDTQGKLVAKGELQLNVLSGSLNLLQLNLSAKSNINVDVIVTGIIFF